MLEAEYNNGERYDKIMAITVKKLQNYMKNELNIIITGPAGTGKTQMLQEAAKVLGMKMKYYSASTLDPYTDLVGIPVPQNDTKTVEYYRPRDLDDAEIVFFDELNRADVKTLNTVFELIQFKSINGEKLPNLKVVVAAINPNDGDYTVDDLDIALLDRFDIYLTSEPAIDMVYFKKKFGYEIASATKSFWDVYEKSRKNSLRNSSNQMAYISPRRMEKIISAFIKIPEISTINDTMPVGVNVSTRSLYDSLTEALKPKKNVNKANSGKKKVSVSEGALNDFEILMRADNIRHSHNRNKLRKVLNNNNLSNQQMNALMTYVAAQLSSGVSPEKLASDWDFVLEKMNSSAVQLMTGTWNNYKRNRLTMAANGANISLKV